MIAIALKNIEKYYGVHKVLSNVTFEINEGEKVALIGGNGTGKTTILKIISGEHYEGGQLTTKKRLTLGYLEQMTISYPGLSGIDILNQGNSVLGDIRKRLTELEELMALETDPDLQEKLMKNYGTLLEQFEALGGYSAEAKISAIVEGLQIEKEGLFTSFDNLSGGEKTKLLFAQMLISEPELLLLDEPTNHLDIDAIEWLEGFIKNYKGTVLLVSHDRYFLDKSIVRIIELEDGECQNYPGNYSYYIKEKERRLLVEFDNYQDQQKRIKGMEAAIKRLRDWGLRGDNEKFFKRAESMQKSLDKIERMKKPILDRKNIDLSFDINDRSGRNVVICEDISKTFGPKTLFANGQFHLRFKEQIGLLGGNGTGKTTFFKMLLGELETDSGRVEIGARVKIGYLPQIIELEDGNRTVLEEFRHSYRCTEGEARGILARFLFYKDSVFKRIKDLSGGERTRIRLAQLMHEDVNLLLLDEPTNHLDLETREVLEEALQDFDGTLLFISHDRYFINKLAEKIYCFENQQLNLYKGNYDYFREKSPGKSELSQIRKVEMPSLEHESLAQKQEILVRKHENPPQKKEFATHKTMSEYTKSQNIKKEAEIEAIIAQLEGNIILLQQAMTKPDVASDYMMISELSSKVEMINEEIAQQYNKWEALTAKE